MNDPLIARFADACGASAPLELQVELADGGLLAEGIVGQPFTLLGRDDACDVTLTDPEVNLRHAWFQVVGGRVYAIDLGSRTGLGWPDGAVGSGWLDTAHPVRIGPFQVLLTRPVTGHPTGFRPGYSPLQSDPAVAKARPAVTLEFRNGKRAKDRWTVNRLVTLVGRSAECKIHLNAEDVAGFHCGLVLTPTGLWVVDLSGRGVVVNGERMRVAPLAAGAELWVGRFLIGCQYPEAPTSTSLPRTADKPGSSGRLTGGRKSKPKPAPPDDGTAEDEVPLGIHPASDVAAGMPSSHIMAEAMRSAVIGPGQANSPVSGTLLVTGSSGVVPTPPAPPRPSAEAVAAAEAVIVPLVRQLGEFHSQMFDQLQQSMLLMVSMFGQAHRDQMAVMQEELTRIRELNAELAKLQAEVARLAMAQAFGEPVGRRTTHDDDATVPEMPALPQTVAEKADTAAAIHDWVHERIQLLQQERQSRWERLVGAMTASKQ